MSRTPERNPTAVPHDKKQHWDRSMGWESSSIRPSSFDLRDKPLNLSFLTGHPNPFWMGRDRPLVNMGRLGCSSLPCACRSRMHRPHAAAQVRRRLERLVYFSHIGRYVNKQHLYWGGARLSVIDEYKIAASWFRCLIWLHQPITTSQRLRLLYLLQRAFKYCVENAELTGCTYFFPGSSSLGEICGGLGGGCYVLRCASLVVFSL